MSSSTKRKNYYPAEWELQDAILLTWPHQHSDWKTLLNSIEPVYTSIVNSISQYQNIIVLCYDEPHKTHIIQTLKHSDTAKHKHIYYISCKSDDTWARDYAAITVIKNAQTHLLDFTFNGWGDKYSHSYDNQISKQLNSIGLFSSMPLAIPLVLEGGSIDSDGHGTILTTSRCLLKSQRNPQLSQAKLEQELKNHLSIERILWLDHGTLIGDDTDGHIDNLARFTNKNTIAYLKCNDQSDPHYQALQPMEQQLSQFLTQSGEPYKLCPISMPSPRYGSQQQRLPASYINFLIINGAVLVPIFNADEDQAALNSLQLQFPDRDIIGINCLALLEQNGGLHCATMQFPLNSISTTNLSKPLL